MTLIAIEAIWEYQSAANTVPVDMFDVDVPSSGWTSGGISPFGDGTFADLGLLPPNTLWTNSTGLWIRRNVVLDGQSDVIVKGNCEQAMYMYLDGVFVGTMNPTNAARSNVLEYNVVIPRALATEGTHEIALLCIDDAAVDTISYISVVADYAPAMIALQPESPATEELIWLSEIQIANDGSEDPMLISEYPRQRFSYIYPATLYKKIRALITVWGALGDKWLVPVWGQARLYGAVAEGLTTLESVDVNTELRPGFVLLWQSDSVYQIIGFDSFDGDDLLLNNPTAEFTNAWLMPLRYAFINDNATKKFDGHEASFDLKFSVLDNDELTPAAPDQYLGDDIYTEPTLLSSNSSSDDLTTSIDVFDPGAGLVAFYRNWTNTKVARTYRKICEGYEENWDLRNFLHRRAGKSRPFWEPSFENDLTLQSTGTIVSTMLVSRDDYVRFASNRTHIAIEADSVWYPREITAVGDVSAEIIQLTLDSPLNVAATSVSRICWLGLKRLNTDRVEIRYIGAGVTEINFRTLEISP